MALKATIYKVSVNITDTERHVYGDVSLTVAQHPSETKHRMMLRLLAWICHAHDRLLFTKGLCADDQPEIWRRNDHGEIELWIELGLPDEKRLKRACHRARQVVLYAYGERAARVWWQQNQARLVVYPNLQIRFLHDQPLSGLVELISRNMQIQAIIQESTIWLSDCERALELQFDEWQRVVE